MITADGPPRLSGEGTAHHHVSGQVARTRGSRIAGLVSCLPPRRIENSHFTERFGAKLDDVVKMTGVRTRYWVEDGTTTSDLCARAADELLDPAWGLLAEARVPVVMHCGSGPAAAEYTGPGPVARVLARHPRLRLIVAHRRQAE